MWECSQSATLFNQVHGALKGVFYMHRALGSFFLFCKSCWAWNWFLYTIQPLLNYQRSMTNTMGVDQNCVQPQYQSRIQMLQRMLTSCSSTSYFFLMQPFLNIYLHWVYIMHLLLNYSSATIQCPTATLGLATVRLNHVLTNHILTKLNSDWMTIQLMRY